MRLALEEDMEVVGEAGDAAGAISLARALDPDVVLMDIEIPGGVALTKALHTVAPRSAVVIFTLRDDAETQERAREAGAAAFVAKHRTEEALLAAIREATVAHG
jgi:DNA-binding NarL/FixJ family response regulator